MRKFILLFVLQIVASLGAYAQTIQEGLLALKNENLKGAQKIFEQIISREPKNALAYYHLGEVFVAQGDFKSASTAFNNGVAADKNAAVNYVGQGFIQANESNFKEAEKLFGQAIRMTKAKDPNIYAAIANSYLKMSKPQAGKAIEHAKIARDLQPSNPAWHNLLGDAYQAGGDYGAAMNSYENSLAKDANNADVLFKMANIWSSSQPKRAIENLERVIKLQPQNALAYRTLGDLYQRDKQYDKVPAMLDKYLQLAGNDTEARYRLVRYLATYPADNADRIIQEGTTVLNEDKSKFRVNRYISWAYAEKGEYRKSLDAMNAFKAQMTAEDQLYERDFDALARSYVGLGQIEEAKSVLTKIVETNPEKVSIFGQLGKTYLEAKDYVNAAEMYQTLVDKSPKPDLNDLVQLGYCYNMSKNWVKCDEVFARVVSLSPTYVYGWVMRARCNEQLDDENAPRYLARPHYQKIIDILEADAAAASDARNKGYLLSAYNYLGFAEAGASNFDSAIAWFNKTLALDPNNSTAQQAVANVAAVRGGK